MKPRKNHLYIQEDVNSPIYKEFHIQDKLRPTGRTFKLLAKLSAQEALAYHKKKGEMILHEFIGDEHLLLCLKEGETDE